MVLPESVRSGATTVAASSAATSRRITTVVVPIVATKPLDPGVGGPQESTLDEALAVTGFPATVHVTVWFPENVGRKAPRCVPGRNQVGGTGDGSRLTVLPTAKRFCSLP